MALSVSVVLLVSAACAPAPPGGIYYSTREGSITPDGLHLLLWEPFKVTCVKPGADLARYQKVLVQDVTIAYKTPPRSNQSTLDPSYAIPDSALQATKNHFRDEFVRALGQSENFTVTKTPGPDVLVIEGHIVDLALSVPPQRDQDPDSSIYTSSSGQMKLILDARDAQSGEALVRIGQGRSIDSADGGWYESNPVSNSSAVRRILADWANSLRRELDQLHSLPQLPSVPGSAAPTS